MSEIQSEKAKERIEYYSDDTDFIYPLTKEQILEVVAIAERQADERHRHETRWRSVEEELPDGQGIVLAKTDTNSFATAYLHGKSSGFIAYGDTAYLDFGKITHWKPIE